MSDNNSLKSEFHKFSKFDRFLLKYKKSRLDVVKTFFTKRKEAGLVALVFVVVPPPFSFVSISPFILWYMFSPAKKIKELRSQINKDFHKAVLQEDYEPFIKKQNTTSISLKHRKLFKEMFKEDVTAVNNIRKNLVQSMRNRKNKVLGYFSR